MTKSQFFKIKNKIKQTTTTTTPPSKVNAGSARGNSLKTFTCTHTSPSVQSPQSLSVYTYRPVSHHTVCLSTPTDLSVSTKFVCLHPPTCQSPRSLYVSSHRPTSHHKVYLSTPIGLSVTTKFICLHSSACLSLQSSLKCTHRLFSEKTVTAKLTHHAHRFVIEKSPTRQS